MSESRPESGSQSRDAKNILARLERLERQNRRLKGGALGFLLLFAACVGLMGQAKQAAKKPPAKAPAAAAPVPAAPAAPAGPRTVEAENFILKDSNGRVRAELTMNGAGPSFKLRDASGSALMTLSLNDGAPNGPLVLLSDPQHHASLAMSVLEGAGSQLSLTGERPDIQARVGVSPDGTTFEISDKDGFATSIGSGIYTKGTQVKKTSAASLALFGKDRKLLWSAP